MNSDDLRVYGNTHKADDFIDSLHSGTFLFSMVMSYTATCEIPGISIAGADADSFKFTPPADAEYLHYGHCKSIDGIPVTPDGKPTPALLAKAALESSSIPHMIINAGSRILPDLPFIETGLDSGNNIRYNDAMTIKQTARAVDYGRIVGRTLATLADCLVIGESIPGGTTTAMAVLHGLGFPVRVSSSMPENPLKLKEQVVRDALMRIETADSKTTEAKTDTQQQQHNCADSECGSADCNGSLNDNAKCDHNNPNPNHNNPNPNHNNPNPNHNNHNPNHNNHNPNHNNHNPNHNNHNPNHNNPNHTDQMPADSACEKKRRYDDDNNVSSFLTTQKHYSTLAEKLQHLYMVVSKVGDPMIPFVAGMLSSASTSSKVMLAGGTQMAAVLAFASGIEFNDENVAVGTTTYVADDKDADFASMISQVADVPAIAVDPGLENSKYPGLCAFAKGYAKEGVGAGGCMISSMLKSGMRRTRLVDAVDTQYKRLFE